MLEKTSYGTYQSDDKGTLAGDYRKQAIKKRPFHTDIQLKTLSQRIEVFNMKIIMRRDFMIFQFENHKN